MVLIPTANTHWKKRLPPDSQSCCLPPHTALLTWEEQEYSRNEGNEIKSSMLKIVNLLVTLPKLALQTELQWESLGTPKGIRYFQRSNEINTRVMFWTGSWREASPSVKCCWYLGSPYSYSAGVWFDLPWNLTMCNQKTTATCRGTWQCWL